MAKKLRIGFIGTGGMANVHYPRLMATKKAEVTALTDPDPEAFKRFHERNPGTGGLPKYQTYEEMLANEELDGVVILSPHTVHYEQICTCLEKGLHVQTEKPMVCRIEHAKDLIARVKKAQRVLMIGYQRHYQAEFRYMRDQIKSGALGEVQFVQAIQAQEWLRATAKTWRQELKMSGGGQLNDSGSHLIDIVMWVTGLKVAEVFAKSENFKGEVDINTTVAMNFENGALGSMSVIGNAPSWYEDVTIVGAKGAFYLRQGLGLIHVDAVGKPIEVKLPTGFPPDPDADFVDCVLNGTTPQTPPECGLRTIEVTEAAWQSAASGKPVRVP